VLCQLSYSGVQWLTPAQQNSLKSRRIERTIELTMATLNHISVEIGAKFGSTFQEETALRMLQKVVQGWKDFYSKHSKNTIEFRITGVEAAPHGPASITNR
jgi:hypothetical protein